MLGRERNPMEETALARRRGGLEQLYDLFAQAPVLGSLIAPRRVLGDFGNLFAENFDGLVDVLGKVLAKVDDNFDAHEAAVTAQGLAKAAELLSKKFTLVATNVPYLARAKMAPQLGKYIDTYFPIERTELANVFLINITNERAHTSAIVSPQNYLFMKSYQGVRDKLLKGEQFRLVAKLGPAAFQEMNWWAAVTALTITANSKSDNSQFSIIELGQHRATNEKPIRIIKDDVYIQTFSSIIANPASNIAVNMTEAEIRLRDIAVGTEGLSTGDVDRFVRHFWERASIDNGWQPFQRAPKRRGDVEGATDIIWWEDGSGELSCSEAARIQGHAAWTKRGVIVGAINQLIAVRYTGELYDKMCVAIVPKDEHDLAKISRYCVSAEYYKEVRKLSQKAHVATGILTQVPFPNEMNFWPECDKPFSNDPTQWLFDGDPRGSADPNILDEDDQPIRPVLAEHPLQVAVARLLGYSWPRRTGSAFMDCPALTEPDVIELSDRIDADGIVCLPSLHGKAGASERLRGLLQAGWAPPGLRASSASASAPRARGPEISTPGSPMSFSMAIASFSTRRRSSGTFGMAWPAAFLH